MRSNSIFAVCGERFQRWRGAAFLIAVLAATTLLSGIWLLWLHAQGGPQVGRAAAAVCLVVFAVLQLRCAWLAWQRPRLAAQRPARILFLKWVFSGAVLCYAAGLSFGPDPGVGYLFCAAVAGWYTAGLWLIVTKPDWVWRLSLSLSRCMLGRTNHIAFAGICVVVVAESIVRLYSLVANDPLPETYVARLHALPPGQEVRGRQVNTLGYWDKEFRPDPRPGIFRVAVLGDAVTLSGTSETNCLSLIENRVPGVEVYNFGIPQAGPREYSAQLARDVVRFRPDLVIAFLNVGDDLTEAIPLPGWFDWRGLRMYQLGARSGSLGVRAVAEQVEPKSMTREEYVRRCALHLNVCRTPIDDVMSVRWQETSSYIAQMTQICRQEQVPLALVVVPGPFQLNATLCEALRRQAGFEPGQIDLNLPQRRLASLATEQNLPLVDLLPYLQSSSTTVFERCQTHLSEDGNRVAAEVVGRWIEQHFRTQMAAVRQAATP